MRRRRFRAAPLWLFAALVLLPASSAQAGELPPGIGDRLYPEATQGATPEVPDQQAAPADEAPRPVAEPAKASGAVAPEPVGTMLPRRVDPPSAPAVLPQKEPKVTDSTFSEASPPFAGSDLFVGRSVKVPTRKVRVEVGVAGQVVPLNLVLATSRSALIGDGVTAACSKSTDPDCAMQAATYAGQALAVLDSIPDSRFAGVLAASKNPASLETTLKSVGVTSASDITAVQKYLGTIPSAQRTQAILLARRLADQTAAVRLEPFASVNLKPVQVRLGVPMSLAVRGAGTAFDLGNLNVDLVTGWTLPVRHASLGLSIGIMTCLPTSTGSERVSLMADLFQASKYLYGYLTFAPYVVAGVDAKWVSLQVHADLWIQARVRSIAAASNAEVFQYGTGLTILPHFPVSVIGQLEGLEGLNNATAFRSLFVVAGLQLNLWYVRLGVAAQVPLVDRNRENLGTYGGMDVGGLAKYTILARTSVSF